MSVPPKVGLVLSCKLATMTELSCTLGLEALEDLVDVALTDAHNARIIADMRRREDEE